MKKSWLFGLLTIIFLVFLGIGLAVSPQIVNTTPNETTTEEGDTTSTPPSSSSVEVVTTVVDFDNSTRQSIQPLTADNAANAALPAVVCQWTIEAGVKLTDGSVEIGGGAKSGGSNIWIVGDPDEIALIDTDGDGDDEAFFPIGCNHGGSSTYFSLIYLNSPTDLAIESTSLLVDEITKIMNEYMLMTGSDEPLYGTLHQILEVDATDGILTIVWEIRTEADPNCCASIGIVSQIEFGEGGAPDVVDNVVETISQ